MPGKNLEKIYVEHGYYHLYNRGVNKAPTFMDDEDFRVFLNLMKRYLSPEVAKDKKGRPYPNYSEEIELLAFCLMPNHFHMLVYQLDADGMTHLLRSLSTAYGMYFNKKYKRVGPVFQNRFRASHILRDDYLQHITRYIHLNPRDYRAWQYSSLAFYSGDKYADWVHPDRILEVFDHDRKSYLDFVSDYEEQKQMLEEIKHELANP